MCLFSEMVGSYCQAIRSYATFHGRTGRRDYWLYFLCNIILMTILFFTPLVMLIFSWLNHMGVMMQTMQDSTSISTFSIVCLVWFFIGCIYVLFMIIPNAAISARRLHDINISGKWLWFVYIPLIIQVVVRLAKVFIDIESVGFGVIISLLVVTGVLGIVVYTARIVFITLHSLKSDSSDNCFGPYLIVEK